ncbi:hypothetical protein SEVIR_6G128706v4 [Setaria viridis]
MVPRPAVPPLRFSHATRLRWLHATPQLVPYPIKGAIAPPAPSLARANAQAPAKLYCSTASLWSSLPRTAPPLATAPLAPQQPHEAQPTVGRQEARRRRNTGAPRCCPRSLPHGCSPSFHLHCRQNSAKLPAVSTPAPPTPFSRESSPRSQGPI